MRKWSVLSPRPIGEKEKSWRLGLKQSRDVEMTGHMIIQYPLRPASGQLEVADRSGVLK